MNKLLRHLFPLSLRLRFLLATAGVVLVLSLAYGMVALVGYSVSFDKTTFRLLRGKVTSSILSQSGKIIRFTSNFPSISMCKAPRCR